jgi:hypothetical protein
MTEKFWRLLRICYTKLARHSLPPLIYEKDAENVSAMIYDLLNTDKPCMIARFGATEITTMVNYLGVKQGKPDNIFKYIKGDYLDWW